MRTVLLTILAGTIIALAPFMPAPDSPQPRAIPAIPATEHVVTIPADLPPGDYVAVDASTPSQCVSDLLALGWTGDPADGHEAVIAPQSVYTQVCAPLVRA